MPGRPQFTGRSREDSIVRSTDNLRYHRGEHTLSPDQSLISPHSGTNDTDREWLLMGVGADIIEGVEEPHAHVRVKIRDSNLNITFRDTVSVRTGSRDYNPGIPIPDGGEVELDAKNPVDSAGDITIVKSYQVLKR